jgi:formylglycine-generating enzyme required for sulfatase activity
VQRRVEQANGYRQSLQGFKNTFELGIYDMSGNVCEWCSDWYDIYPALAQQNPAGASSGSLRVFRGGSWNNTAEYCRVAYRYYFFPSYRDGILGFRLVLP